MLSYDLAAAAAVDGGSMHIKVYFIRKDACSFYKTFLKACSVLKTKPGRMITLSVKADCRLAARQQHVHERCALVLQQHVTSASYSWLFCHPASLSWQGMIANLAFVALGR